MSGASALPGREGECAVLARFLADIRDHALDQSTHRHRVIEGEHGIGRTTLLEYVMSHASDLGFVVLSARCVAAESEWRFTLLGELFDAGAHFDKGLDLAAADHVVADSTLHLLQRMAQQAPVVLVIDDLQWADTASLTVLSHALRRLRTERVCCVGAVTTAEAHGTTPLAAMLPGPDDRLSLQGLSLGALGEILRTRLATSIPRRLAVQIHEATGGNPRFALELARASLTASDGGNLQSSVPASLAGLIEDKVDALPSRTRTILQVAALANDPTAELICDTVGQPATVWSDIDLADRSGLARWVDGRIVFAHPLVRSVIAANAPADERRAAHRALADAVTDIEERARHSALAADGYDEEVASMLDLAVEHASQRSARHAAAELAELAVAQTPPSSPRALFRMISAARHLVAALDLENARAMLERVVFVLPPGPGRAMALGHLAAVMRGLGESNEVWSSLVTRALSEADEEPSVVGPLHIQLAISSVCSRRIDDFASHIENAAAIAAGIADNNLMAQVNSARAMLALMRGTDAEPALSEALTLGAASGPPELRPHITAIAVLRHRDELAAARAHAEEAYAHVIARGVDIELPSLMWQLIELEVWAGNWDRAETLLDTGWELARWAHTPLVRMLHSLSAATLHAHRGQLEQARSEAETALVLAQRAGYPLFESRALSVLGFIELSLEDYDRVDEVLHPIATEAVTKAMGEPGLWRLVPDEVEALVRLGRVDEADAILTPFEARARELDREWALAASGRCRALIVQARGGDALGVIDQAVVQVEKLGMPFETARTLLVAAEINRRARRRGQARAHASNALVIFERLRASAWTTRAQRELGRGGSRGPSDDTLSTVERQIALLVSEGLSNREIAGQAFMAVRTVEAHLTSIYRKLSVRSRTQLAAALDDASGELGA